MIEQKMIEEGLTLHGFREWLASLPSGCEVGFTATITGEETYPADQTVIARYLQECFPGNVIWAKLDTIGYWANSARSFTLTQEFGWVSRLLAAIDAIATSPGLQAIMKEQVMDLLEEIKS
jgi:hypothetical protein